MTKNKDKSKTMKPFNLEDEIKRLQEKPKQKLEWVVNTIHAARKNALEFHMPRESMEELAWYFLNGNKPRGTTISVPEESPPLDPEIMSQLRQLATGDHVTPGDPDLTAMG